MERSTAIHSRTQADSCIRHFASVKQYDSVALLVHSFIGAQIKSGAIKDAVLADTLAFGLVEPGSTFQKNIAGFLYEQRAVIEKDTTALRVFYDFFTVTYTLYQSTDTYDPQFIAIAEYFINLQKKHPQLSADNLIYFLEGLGIGYNVAGDLKKASAYYNELLAYDLQHGDPGNIASTASNLCIALTESNYNDSVLHFTGRLMRTYHFPKKHLLNLHIIRAEACLQVKDLPGANDELQQADQLLATLTDREDSVKKAFELATAKAHLCYASGDFDACIRASHLALNLGLRYNKGNAHDRYLGKIWLLAGAAWRQVQQPDSACRYFHQALYTVTDVDTANSFSLPHETDVYAENTLMDALDSLATIWDEVYTRTHDTRFLQTALQARKLAFIAEKKLLEAFSYDEAMQAQLLQSKKRSEKALQDCYRLWQNTPDSRWVQEALMVNEHSKAIALLHSVKRNIFLKSLPEKDSAVASLNRLRYQLIMLERQLNAAPDQPSKDSIRRELDTANRLFLAQESAVGQKYPAFKRTGTDTAMVRLSSLHQNLLQDNDCLLQYFVADSGAFVLWIDRNEHCGIFFLPATALQLADSFSAECNRQHGLFEKDNAAFFKLATACTRAIIPPAVQKMMRDGQCRKLVLVPDGPLSRLPFAALSTDGNTFLAGSTTIYTGYSLSTLLANDPVPGDNKNLFVFTPFSKQGFHRQARLPFTRDEANAIRKAWPAAVIIDDTAATVTRFSDALQHAGIIHIATHASTSREDVPRIFFSDRVLYMPELYAAGTRAELVVLSGCETGAGTLDPNEGPLSLSRAFYYAGAKNIINSLWQTDDAATADIFGSFYNNYTIGHTGSALHKARQDYLKTHPGQGRAPYYWAGLVHIGLDKKTGGNTGYGIPALIFCGVFFPATALLLFLRKRRRKTPAG